jgi:prefoldin subunit 5
MSLALLGQAIIKKVANKKIRILSKILDLKSKFDNGCPTTPELTKIINQRNQLIKILTQLKQQILLIDKTTTPLKTLITTLTLATKLLKLAPVPVAVGSPAVALPLGNILTAGNTLNNLDTKINGFSSLVLIFGAITKYILKTIDEILAQIKTLDALVEKCANENAQISGDNLAINNSLNAEDSTLINNLQSPNKDSTNTYKGFILEVLLDDKNDTRFPKRYAVAKTPGGVIVLRGESSFSSSVDVLLDEIKFIIDRDNLKL